MPRYRFTTDDGKKLDVGRDRLELPNDASAEREAQRALADMANEHLPDGPHLKMLISVENEAGEVIYQASLEFNGENADDMKAKAELSAKTSLNGARSRPTH